MNEVEDRVYRELRQNLDKLPISYPASKSGDTLK